MSSQLHSVVPYLDPLGVQIGFLKLPPELLEEIDVDNFAGGGGATEGQEEALKKPVAIAINHDPEAIALHKANHPYTEHFCESVYDVDPVKVCRGRPVGQAWFSPDCKHHSKARGGKPVEKSIRGLAWVARKWGGKVRPRKMILENVEEFQDWGPLVAKRDKATRRVIKVDGSIAQPREVVPIREQMLIPDIKRKGQTFRRFVNNLKSMGYDVEWRELRACDFGAPTIRKRLFMVARCDGVAIGWPEPTHGKAEGLRPFITAADILDFSIPCPSIFERKRPLAENTQKRIARGLKKYVIEAEKPFIIPEQDKGLSAHHLDRICQTGAGSNTGYPVSDPVKTVCSKNEHIMVATHLSRQFGKSTGADLQDPVPTVTAKNKTAVVQAWLAQHNTGVTGHEVKKPLSTITGRGTQQNLVTANLINMKGGGPFGRRSVEEPVTAICAGGYHVAEVRAFLMKYYSTGGQDQDCREPVHTITAKARLGLVTVEGEPYQITDIGMRMLTPRELYRAQGFPDSYKIEIDYNGKTLTKTAQVRMCGNSVCPPLAAALTRANMSTHELYQVAAQ